MINGPIFAAFWKKFTSLIWRMGFLTIKSSCSNRFFLFRLSVPPIACANSRNIACFDTYCVISTLLNNKSYKTSNCSLCCAFCIFNLDSAFVHRKLFSNFNFNIVLVWLLNTFTFSYLFLTVTFEVIVCNGVSPKTSDEEFFRCHIWIWKNARIIFAIKSRIIFRHWITCPCRKLAVFIFFTCQGVILNCLSEHMDLFIAIVLQVNQICFLKPKFWF